MLINPAGKAATKAASAKNGPAARAPAAAKHASMAQGASLEGTATAATAARSTTMPDQSRRAEALVRHVTQLPTFLNWAAANYAETATAASPRGVAQYLEERVSEVAAQLDSLQHAGDYARLVVLLTELLHGDMRAGITPLVIDCGLLKLLRATATAVANGEHATLPAAASVALSSPAQTFTAPSAAVKRAAGDCSGTALLSSQDGTHGGGAATAGMLKIPIESLLPPLIDQTARKPKGGMGILDGGTASPEQTENEAEMEAWENYMATVRVATTTADAPHTRDAVVRAVDADSTPGFVAAAAAGVVAAATVENHTRIIQSLPDALYALIASCTAAPFISLTLLHQQCEKAAVVSVADALIGIAAEMPSDSAELAAVRLAAIKGLYLLLSTYIAGRTGEGDSTASQVSILRGVQPSKVRTQGSTATSASPMLLLDSEDLAEMLNDITLDWAHILARLGGAHLADGTQAQESKMVINKNNSSDEDAEAGEEDAAVEAAAAAAANSGSIAELNWIPKIALLLLHAQQHVCQRGVGGGGAVVASQTPYHALPRHLLPVVLRTLALLRTTPALSTRAATYSRQCVDVLWTASLLAPVAASRQLLYGSLPLIGRPGVEEGNVEETSSPAVDFFLALLHQFNETHSLAHREMRDDLVSLLALLLRCDRQFVEDELMLRRGVSDGAGAAAAAVARGERSSSISGISSPPLYESGASSPVGRGDDTTASSPLSLSVATVEAVNAIVALLFETTCGAELDANAMPNTLSSRTGGTAREEVRPSMLLSEEAVRSYALRFQSVTISAARRREAVEFKKYGWQLLEVHIEWQLAHLTFREYIALHDPAAPSPSAATKQHHHHHERSSPIPLVTGEAAQDEAVTASLWAMQLSRLGFFDVLLLYVDMDSSVPAVVTWTREELMLLEQEAWQLFTSMILLTQHLDTVSGGIRVRRRRCYGPTSFSHGRGAGAEKQRACYSKGLSDASIGVREEDEITNADDDDGANGGVLYGADIHFIAAGGVGVALRFLTAAPAEMEAVKRSALATVAAIARTSSSSEAHLHSGAYTTNDLALAHRALIEYAPSLVPFLVRIICEVDAHVSATGMPATTPSLITASVTAAAARNAGVEGGARASMSVGAAQTEGRWGWLPHSAGLSVFFAWCLLRSIGDVVLTEVGMVRELPEVTVDMEKSESDNNEEEESAHDIKNSTHPRNHHNDHDEDDKTSSISSCAGTARQSAVDRQYSVGSLPPPLDRLEGTGTLFHDAAMAEKTEGGGKHEVQPYPAELNISVVDDDTSSSGSFMGPPPGEEAAGVVTAPMKGFEGHKSGSGRVRDTASTRPNIVSTKIHTRKQHSADADASLGGCPARRRNLLSSVHEDVLLIPEMFAAEGGIDALVVWIRHTLRLCLSARGHTTQSSLHHRVSLPELSVEEVAELDAQSDLFLLLLDVFRAIVLGSVENEEMFVRSGGVHGLLDLIEAFALAHGLIRRAADYARTLAVDINATAYQRSSSSTARDASRAQRVKEGRGVMHYATTLLSDLLENCPCTLDELATWHSGLIFTSPLAPDVQECRSGSKGVEAVPLLLCLWAAGLPARGDPSSTATTVATGLELLRVHLRPALRMALKAEYVSRLLQRRARMGALKAETIRSYYRYIHSDSTDVVAAEEEVTDAVVLAYMDQLVLSHRKRNAVPADQQIALFVNDTLGLCLKVYGCLAAVGFDSLRAAETETAASPSLHVNLSSLERSILVQIAALPALCVDEISTAMAEVALGNLEGAGEGSGGLPATEPVSVASWRPTTPDRTALSTAATESAIRASELNQIIEVGAQVQRARQEQLYHRYLVTQLRQPVAPPADGRPGAVRGAWKMQRRLSTTVGGNPITAAHGAASSVRGVQQGQQAVELAARLSTRLAAEEQQLQRNIAATVCAKSTMRRTQSGRKEEEEDNSGSARLMATAPPALGSSRTPYPTLMGSMHGAAAERQLAMTPFNISAPPRRPAVSLTERHQKRRAMIARSERKASVDTAVVKKGQKP